MTPEKSRQTASNDADFVIRCGGYKFLAHRGVLAAHSKYFRKFVLARGSDNSWCTMLELPSKLHTNPDRGEVEVFEPYLIQDTLFFFYFLELTPSAKELKNCSRLAYLAQLYRTAARLQARAMMDAAGRLFEDSLPNFNNDAKPVTGPPLSELVAMFLWVYAQPDLPNGSSWKLPYRVATWIAVNVRSLLLTAEIHELLKNEQLAWDVLHQVVRLNKK